MLKSDFNKYRYSILQLCEDEGVKKLMLFGSTQRDESDGTSDIDLLVEFKENKSLFKLISLKHKFEDLFHNQVDLLTPNALSPYLKDDILKEAEVIYEA